MKEIPLLLTVEEVNVVLKTLGQLPTNSGVFPLLMKIEKQANEYLKENDDANS